MKYAAVAVVALVLAGCGQGWDRPAPAQAGGAIPHAHGVRCQSSQLRLSAGPFVSEMTEQATRVLVVRNVAAQGCTLRGYPTVTLLDNDGRALRFAYRRHGDQELTGSKPALIDLPPGGRAYLAINKNACVGFSRAIAARIRVKLPHDQHVLHLSLQRYPLEDYCGPADPGHVIDIAPIEPRFAALFARS